MMNMAADRSQTEALLASHEEGFRPGWKVVYTVAERSGGRRHWVRIGVAFVNRDQSLNVRLDAIPVNGQMHIRDAATRELTSGRGDPDERFREERNHGNA